VTAPTRSETWPTSIVRVSSALLIFIFLASCRDTIKADEIVGFCRLLGARNASSPLYIRHATGARVNVVFDAHGDFRGNGSCALGACAAGEASWGADGCGASAFVHAHRAAMHCLERASTPSEASGEWCLATRPSYEDEGPPPCRCSAVAAAVAELAIGMTSRRAPLLGLERCWETGPEREGGDGCQRRWTLYDDGSFSCPTGAGRLAPGAADRLLRAAEEAEHAAGDVSDPWHVLRRYRDGRVLRLGPADLEEVERVMGALGSRCGS
jgi:hypothetical protein